MAQQPTHLRGRPCVYAFRFLTVYYMDAGMPRQARIDARPAHLRRSRPARLDCEAWVPCPAACCVKIGSTFLDTPRLAAGSFI